MRPRQGGAANGAAAGLGASGAFFSGASFSSPATGVNASLGADLNAAGVETAASPPNENPADDAAEVAAEVAAGAKLNPPGAAAVDAVPKPNDAVDEAGAAPPKLKVAAAGAGALASAAAPFPSALSRSS